MHWPGLQHLLQIEVLERIEDHVITAESLVDLPVQRGDSAVPAVVAALLILASPHVGNVPLQVFGGPGLTFLLLPHRIVGAAEEVMLLLRHAREQIAQIAQGQRRQAYFDRVMQVDTRRRMIARPAARIVAIRLPLGKL